MAAGGGPKAIIAAFLANPGITIGRPAIGLPPGTTAVVPAAVPIACPVHIESDIFSTAPREDAT